MTEALIALAVALLIMIIFMIIVTTLYFKLFKAFEVLRKQVFAGADVQDNINKTLLKCIDLCADISDMTPEAAEIAKLADEVIQQANRVLSDANEVLNAAEVKAEHARNTIQALRRMQGEKVPGQQIQFKDGKPDQIISIKEEEKNERKD